MFINLPAIFISAIDHDWRFAIRILISKKSSIPSISAKVPSSIRRKVSKDGTTQMHADDFASANGSLFELDPNGKFSILATTPAVVSQDVTEGIKVLRVALANGNSLEIIEAMDSLQQAANFEHGDEQIEFPQDFSGTVALKWIYSADMQLQIQNDSFYSLAYLAEWSESYGYNTPETRLLYPYAALVLGINSSSLYQQVATTFNSMPASQQFGVDLDLAGGASSATIAHNNAIIMAAASIVYEYSGSSPIVVDAALQKMLMINPVCRFALLHRAIRFKAQGFYANAVTDLNQVIATSSLSERKLAEALRAECLKHLP